MFSRCVVLVAVLVLIALPLSQQQISQCFTAFLQFNDNLDGNAFPEYCQGIQHRFNDQEYRIDFTQEEVADICMIDYCLAGLQEWDIYCKIYVSLKDIVTD